MTETTKADNFRKRLRKLKRELEFDTWEDMAEALHALGFETKGNHMSGWRRPPGPGVMAGLSLLHPVDPMGCLQWLRGVGDMPRIHVDWDVGAPNGARTLYRMGEGLAAVSEASRLLARGARQAADDVLGRVFLPEEYEPDDGDG